ncbi:hypothetical protein [Sorangium sp. So ce1078]|uniref:hypothetical protein n=1 Tax=Sorangium sp. So ce1078 TaxID=3133329 RepID=UPI003F5EF7CF
MSLEPHEAFRVWTMLVADEALYDATLAGRHAELAASRGLDARHVAVLDELHRQPGTRWNIENLRFRAAAEVAASLVSYMPRTALLLTRGDPDWLQEIAFEYLAHHRWEELGHLRFSECERFAGYLRRRILKRRRPPEHIEPVLDYELSVIALLKKTAAIPAAAWPTDVALDDDATLAGLRLRAAPATAIVDLPVNLLDWIRSGDPRAGEVRDEPLSLLLVVPSLGEAHRIWTLREGPRSLFPLFNGQETTREVAERAGDELGFERDEVFAMARRWLTQRALAA